MTRRQQPDDLHDLEREGDLETDSLPFVMVPRWMIRHASGRALRVWCALWALSDYSTRATYPGKRRLAADLGCSEETVDRGLRELIDLGAVLVTHRTTADGRQTSNLYRLRWRQPQQVGGADLPPSPPADLPPSGGADLPPLDLELQEPEKGSADAPPPAAGGAGQGVLEVLQPERQDGGVLVARWVDGYRETHDGTDPPQSLLKRVARPCAALAKDGATPWPHRVALAVEAGRRAFLDVVLAQTQGWAPGASGTPVPSSRNAAILASAARRAGGPHPTDRR